MEDQKLDNLLSLALDATKEELEKSEELDVGYDQGERTWEVIVRYSGSYQELLAALPAVPRSMESVGLSGGYAILTGTRNQIEALAALPQIEYVEKLRRLYFSVSIGRTASCVYALQTVSYDLFGEGVLVAVIDSGERVIMMSVSKNPVNTRDSADLVLRKGAYGRDGFEVGQACFIKKSSEKSVLTAK